MFYIGGQKQRIAIARAIIKVSFSLYDAATMIKVISIVAFTVVH